MDNNYKENEVQNWIKENGDFMDSPELLIIFLIFFIGSNQVLLLPLFNRFLSFFYYATNPKELGISVNANHKSLFPILFICINNPAIGTINSPQKKLLTP